MENTKTVNYTPEQVELAKEMYAAKAEVEAIALAVNHSPRSVIAKLVKEGVYLSKVKVNSSARITKATMIATIAAAMGASEESLESLEKCTKECLELLVNKLA